MKNSEKLKLWYEKAVKEKGLIYSSVTTKYEVDSLLGIEHEKPDFEEVCGEILAMNEAIDDPKRCKQIFEL